MKPCTFIFFAHLFSCLVIATANASTHTHLELATNLSANSITAGNSTTLNIAVINPPEHDYHYGPRHDFATNGIVTITLPEGASDLVSQDCQQTNATTMVCLLPEINVGASVDISVTAQLNLEGHRLFATSVDADDISSRVQEAIDGITVISQDPDTSPVDLALEFQTNTIDTEVQYHTSIVSVIRNLDEASTAYFPSIELNVPEQFEYTPKDDRCTLLNGIASCKLPVMPPQSETVIEIFFRNVAEGYDVPINGSIVSTQTDILPGNNEAQLTVNIEPFVPFPIFSCGASDPLCGNYDNNDTQNTDDAEENGDSTDGGQLEQDSKTVPETGNALEQSTSSGGGALSISLQLVLFFMICYCRGRWSRKSQ